MMSLFEQPSAVSIGAAAYSVWQRSCSVRVMGVIARGLFLLAPPQHVVFVSFERYHSPLTINLDRPCDRLRLLEVGTPARFSDNRLIFPSIEIAIPLLAATLWQCPPPAAVSRPRVERRRTLRAIAEGVLARAGDKGWATLLPGLIALPGAPPLSSEYAALLERLGSVRHAVRTDESQMLIAGLTSLLGQGRGLTPSGDDVVIGLLLLLNRWHADHEWATVNRAVIAAAYRATTTISANLIECAAAGQGDERLIDLADGIATGLIGIDECVADALSWGSSSGLDALVGMTLAAL